MLNRRTFLVGLGALLARPAFANGYVTVNLLSGRGDQTTWAWSDETGTQRGQATSSQTSDHTQLVLDALAYAGATGLPLVATGRSYAADGSIPLLMLSRTLTLGPSVCNAIFLDNVSIWSTPKDGGPGLDFDSAEDVTFEQRGGQLLWSGDSAAVRVAPSRRTSVDNTVAGLLLKLRFQAITVAGGSGCVGFDFDPREGSIAGCRIEYGELDGVGRAWATLLVRNPGNADATRPGRPCYFQNNHITGSWIVNATTSAAVQVGESTSPAAARIRHNLFEFNAIQPGSVGADGFNCFGSYNLLRAGVIGNDDMAQGMNRGVVWEPGSIGNRAIVGQILGATGGAVIDRGTGNRTDYT